MTRTNEQMLADLQVSRSRRRRLSPKSRALILAVVAASAAVTLVFRVCAGGSWLLPAANVVAYSWWAYRTRKRRSWFPIGEW